MTDLRALLRDTFAYIQPANAIGDLTAADATRRVAGAPHSIAEITGHLAFWQDWFVARVNGEARAMATSAAQGWPPVSAADWEALRARFLGGLDAAVAIAEDAGRVSMPLSPPIEFPPLANYTIGEALTHVAVHNAHHLGQIITLRQVMGRWPPPSGAWTW